MVLILALVLRKTMVMLLLVLSFMCGYLSYMGLFLNLFFLLNESHLLSVGGLFATFPKKKHSLDL